MSNTETELQKLNISPATIEPVVTSPQISLISNSKRIRKIIKYIVTVVVFILLVFTILHSIFLERKENINSSTSHDRIHMIVRVLLQLIGGPALGAVGLENEDDLETLKNIINSITSSIPTSSPSSTQPTIKTSTL